MNKKQLKGIFPYLVTPTDSTGRLKEEVLGDLVEHLISKGVHGLTPLGSTGEGPYLPWEMRKRVIQIVVEKTSGRVPVIAGVTDLSTSVAAKRAQETEELGVDGIVAILPTYFPVPQDKVVDHFKAVANSVSCPVTLYSNPKFANWDFTIPMLDSLIKTPNINYLKDASGNTAKLLAIINHFGNRLKIFSASSHVPLFVFMMGGIGWMAGPACIIPEYCVRLFELAQQKRWEEALEIQKRIVDIILSFQKFSLAACIKAGLEMQGFKVGPPLPPQKRLGKEGLAVVRQALLDLGVL